MGSASSTLGTRLGAISDGASWMTGSSCPATKAARLGVEAKGGLQHAAGFIAANGLSVVRDNWLTGLDAAVRRQAATEGVGAVANAADHPDGALALVAEGELAAAQVV